MPATVHEMIADSPPLVTATEDEPVRVVLQRMMEHDFSQLPVVTDEGNLRGIVTQQSILRALSNFGVALDQIHVFDAMVEPPGIAITRPEEDIFDLLRIMDDQYAAIVVDDQEKLIGIVTSSDTTEYFRRTSEDRILVENIEEYVKDFIRQAYQEITEEQNSERLDQDARKYTNQANRYKSSFMKALSAYVVAQHDHASINHKIALEIFDSHFGGDRSEKNFDDLSLNDYITMFLDEISWSRYHTTLRLEIGAVRRLLEQVRDTRNKLAHLRGELSLDESQKVRFCHDWLKRHFKALDSHVSDDDTNATAPPDQIMPIVELADPQDDTDIVDTVQSGESRYAPLAYWLQRQPLRIDLVKATFQQVEELIGGKLPASAYTNRSWWANDSVGHSQSKQWLEVGWRVASVNMSGEQVRFARIKDRQKAYIDFFSQITQDLRQKAPFNVTDNSAGGFNWHNCLTLSYHKQSYANFNFVFPRGRRFRVEAYIDSGEDDLNNDLYTRLKMQKEEIETRLGQKVTWEPLEAKRAARVALYYPDNVSITDDEQSLALAREWGAQAMVDFVQAICPSLKTIAQEVIR